MSVEIGNKVRDKITGLVGIVTGLTKWVTGCDTAQVQPQTLHEGRPVDACGIDVTRLEILDSSNILEPSTTEADCPVVAKPGGPQPNVTKPTGAI